MPPYSWFTGHMLAIKPFMDRQPPNAIFNYAVTDMAFDMDKDSFYLDFWPITGPILVTKSPTLASQLMQQYNPVKPSILGDAFTKLSGGPNLISMEDVLWKKWRAILAPAFKPSAMLQQVPKIVDECRVFCAKLRQHALENELFLLEEDTIRYTLEVISRIALDRKFDYQNKDSGMPQNLRAMIDWGSFGTELNPLTRWNPLRPLVLAYYGNKINKYLTAELDKDLVDCLASPKAAEDSTSDHSSGAKSFNDYLIDAYLAEHPRGSAPMPMAPSFKQLACAQLRLFLIGGHDTTATALVYAYHLLSANPAALARLRAEHARVLGRDPSAAGARLAGNPSLVHRLPYTTACIKESLRIFPPASAMRVGGRDVVLTSDEGDRFPTDGCNVWVLHLAMHRDPKLFPDPAAFVPERWLVASGHPLHPPRGAFRPFEFGPRNCVGQTLTMVEMAVTLAMTAREFAFEDAYAEWDRLHPRRGVRTALGDRAYSVEGGGGGSHAVDRYP